MEIEKDLQEIKESYAIFGPKLTKTQLLRLDERLAVVLNRALLADGPEKENIERNYRKLAIHFHPDKIKSSPAILWLSNTLSEGEDLDLCFKTLTSCKEKLTDPAKFKEINFADIQTKAELKAWLTRHKDEASTYTSKNLYSSLINLLDQAGSYFDEVGHLKPRGVKALLKLFPIIFSGFGAALVAEELFAVYALYFMLLKGGQYIGRSDFLELQRLGKTVHDMGEFTAAATTTLLVKLFEMSFWISHGCLSTSLKIGSSLLRLTGVSNNKTLCKDLIEAGKITEEGMKFKNSEFKLIASPFETYLILNEQQYFRKARLGGGKRHCVNDFLHNLAVIDQREGVSFGAKLQLIDEELAKVRDNKSVYIRGSNTALAVDQASEALEFFKTNPQAMENVENELYMPD